VNDVHRTRINAIYRLPGYSGRGPYCPIAHAADGGCDAGYQTAVLEDLEGQSEIHVDEDDTLQDELTRLGDCVDRMGIN
jgi:hypothetical protein